MKKPSEGMAAQIADAALKHGLERTGLTPTAVTVVQADGTLVITLHGALSHAEQDLAKTPAGAKQVQEFHRELFANNGIKLRSEIKRITGVEVRDAAAEVDPTTGAVVAVFATGTIVQVFLLKKEIRRESWESGAADGP